MMQTLVAQPLVKGSQPSRANAAEQRIREQMKVVMAAANAVSPTVRERRRELREPYPYPVYLTPLDRAGGILRDETVVVLGKHVSELGFDFYHREPLPYRRGIVSFETRPNHWVGMLLDLTWCRFGRHGWYDNGGRFLASVVSPLADTTTPSLLES